jgi:hypothetical protein
MELLEERKLAAGADPRQNSKTNDQNSELCYLVWDFELNGFVKSRKTVLGVIPALDRVQSRLRPGIQ